MKTLLKCILILCFPALLQAQESTSRPYELGLDITEVINLFNTEINPSARFTARRLGNKSAIRAGLAASFSVDDFTNTNTTNPNETNTAQRSHTLFPSVGYEWHTSLVKNWTLYYGGDLGYSTGGYYSQSEDKSRDLLNEVSSRTNGASLSPLLGIRFTLNDRISFVTESKFALRYSNTKRETTSSTPGNRRTISSDDNTFSGSFRAPVSLYLLIKI